MFDERYRCKRCGYVTTKDMSIAFVFSNPVTLDCCVCGSVDVDFDLDSVTNTAYMYRDKCYDCQKWTFVSSGTSMCRKCDTKFVNDAVVPSEDKVVREIVREIVRRSSGEYYSGLDGEAIGTLEDGLLREINLRMLQNIPKMNEEAAARIIFYERLREMHPYPPNYIPESFDCLVKKIGFVGTDVEE